jgi:hypothetical protein
MEIMKFTFVIRKPDGQEYEIVVSAGKKTDAVRRLKNLLETLASKDKIVTLKEPQPEK